MARRACAACRRTCCVRCLRPSRLRPVELCLDCWCAEIGDMAERARAHEPRPHLGKKAS